eukprot:2770736-Rhodomonas_salina.1
MAHTVAQQPLRTTATSLSVRTRVSAVCSAAPTATRASRQQSSALCSGGSHVLGQTPSERRAWKTKANSSKSAKRSSVARPCGVALSAAKDSSSARRASSSSAPLFDPTTCQHPRHSLVSACKHRGRVSGRVPCTRGVSDTWHSGHVAQRSRGSGHVAQRSRGSGHEARRGRGVGDRDHVALAGEGVGAAGGLVLLRRDLHHVLDHVGPAVGREEPAELQAEQHAGATVGARPVA